MRNTPQTPEKTITFQPTPARAGFSIFCQILTSPNMRQARLPRIHPILLDWPIDSLMIP